MKLLQHMILGCLISLSTSYSIITIRSLAIEGHVFNGQDLLQELLTALALGVIIGALTLILHSERFSFPILVGLHFIIVQCTVFTVGAFAQWYTFTLPSMLAMFAIIVAVYVITWTIVLVLEKRDVKKLNALIRQRRS